MIANLAAKALAVYVGYIVIGYCGQIIIGKLDAISSAMGAF